MHQFTTSLSCPAEISELGGITPFTNEDAEAPGSVRGSRPKSQILIPSAELILLYRAKLLFIPT